MPNMLIERNGYRIQLQGPDGVIESLVGSPDFNRLLPGLTVSFIQQASDCDVVIRLFEETNVNHMRVEPTVYGWDAHIAVNDIGSLLYGFLAPAVSASITKGGWFHLDAAAVSIEQDAVLLTGRGKSTTAWGLARRGVSLIAEDTVLLDIEGGIPVAHGAPSAINVDARTARSGCAEIDERGRTRANIVTQWVAAAPVASIIYLDPTPGKATLIQASNVDARSWVVSLVADRAVGRSKFISEPFMTAAWTWAKVDRHRLDYTARVLVEKVPVFRLYGDLLEFANILASSWDLPQTGEI